MRIQAHKVGATFYMLWGMLHVIGGAALLPGYMLPSDGGIGIALWLAALVFSTVGLLPGGSPATNPAPAGGGPRATAQ